ncbi:MAG: DUF4173 domain-containing protein [Clostridia bacterium]|nr:DUF4173 domain-containing protein [Clostridia bacterium]
MCENLNKVNLNESVTDTMPPKKVFEITGKDTLFAILFFVSSFLISALGVTGGFNGGFTISAFILTVVMTLYLKNTVKKVSVFSVICLILSITVTLSFLITTNGSVRFWSFVVYYLLTLCWFVSMAREDKCTGDMGILTFMFRPAFTESLPNIPTSLLSLFASKSSFNKNFVKILVGVLLAIPLLFVIIPLLISSDEAFNGMISLAIRDIFSFVLKLILSVIIFIFLISFAFTLKKEEEKPHKIINVARLEPIIVISFLSVLAICYLSYLFSQLAYFFSGFGGFLPKDYKFNVATYARRGFFEMCIIATINFLIIFIVLLLTNKENKKLFITVKSICGFIGVFTLVIIATALSKMFLYIKSFGMTELRITTGMFMVFLTVVFISLLMRIFSEKIKVIKTALITAGIVLTLLGTVNVNTVIATYNYNAYINGALKDIDVSTISNLGDEAIPYLIKLTKNENINIAEMAENELSAQYYNYYETIIENNRLTAKSKISSVEIFNISKLRAYKEFYKYLKKNPEIINDNYALEQAVFY